MTSAPQTVTTRPGTTAGANEATAIPPGYKQTGAGVVPQDWEVRSLEEITEPKEPICYGIVQVGSFSSNGIPVLAIKNLNTDYRTNVHHCSPEIETPYTRSRVHSGDILISVKGTTGRVGIVPAYFEGNISRDLARMRLRDEHLPEYWFQTLQSGAARRALDLATVGTTRLEISIGILKQIRFPFPSLSEQRAIAEALSDVDKLLESLEKLIAKKRAIKQAAMQQLLTGKTRLPGFSGEWQNHQVQNVIRQHFCGPSPTCDERNIEGEDEWGVLKTTAATIENGWDWRQHKALPHAYWGREHQKVESGDVIITKAGPRHRVGVAAWVDYVPDRIIVSGKMIGLRPDARKAVPLMLAAALRARETQIYLDLRTTGMAESQVNFENEDLLKAPILLPPIAEQQAIATVLSDMDADIAALERRRDKIRAVKQGMMQQLLTGRVRLVRPPRTTEASGC